MAKWTVPTVYTQDQLDRAVEEAVAAVTPKVKPLVWGDCGHSLRIVLQSETGFGPYRITQRFFPEMFFSIEPPDGVAFTADSSDRAQAAAQADYERRILDALEPDPNAPAILARIRAEAMREAAGICDDYSANHGSGMFEKHSAACSDAILARAALRGDQP